MKDQTAAFLTIAMEVAPSQLDPLDSPGESKRLMVEKADQLVNDAIARMPGYLSALPAQIRPTVDDLKRVFRRAYRINGPRVEMDLSIIPSALPSAWTEGLMGGVPSSSKTPWPVVWTTKIMGWWFGLGKEDQQKVMKQSSDRAFLERKKSIQHSMCEGVMRLAGAAVEVELRNNHKELMVGGTVLSIAVRRSVI